MNHHVMISLNGEDIGESYWSGTTGHTVDLNIDQTQLIDGDNSVEIKGILDTGSPYSVFYINSFDLTFYRYYQADNDSIIVRGDGNEVVTVYNFSSDDIEVFDLKDRRHPQLLTGTIIEKLDTDHYQVSFSPDDPGTEYLVLTMDTLNDVVSMTVDIPSRLKARRNRADYLVITPPELKEAADRLADYRSANGFATMVVELEDIMNQFNYGIVSPHAIKEFLSYAHSHWQQPPIYVVLAGDGSYDFKNNQGHGDCLLPPLLGSTPHGLFAMDNLFADVSGNDSLPDIAIGRIPAITLDEMNDYIDKIIAFETTGNLAKKALMLADYTDPNDPFSTQSDRLAERFPPDYVMDKVYLADNSTAEARQKILSAINSDLSIVNFVGHGGMDRLSSGGMLKTSDTFEMTNVQSPFIMTALTCVAGRFGLSGYDTLSETLLLQQNSGAVAVWSSAGLSETFESEILGRNFYQALFDYSEAGTIGAAVTRAIHDYSTQGNLTYMLNLYNLLGDPALTIR